ncbi:MAG: sensor histidine kinase [Proteobacteria bacterium]|jgi:Signal transduction histidine kinase|nr:MAG: sensor histidine kinase [Pseudomonadota bacterium]
MLTDALEASKSNSLISQYSEMLGKAILRQRALIAERAARVEAELANKVKSEFIANMSHELRTPLNTIIGFSKLLSEHQHRRLKDENIVEYANLIQDAASHLLSIINDILDISKIQSGKYALDRQELSIEEVLRATLSGFRLAAEEAGVQLEYAIEPSLQLIPGDAVKIRQVISNLISNAIKFTHEGGKVTVEAFRLADGSVAVRVRDTGIGMSEDEIRIALTPFGQVDGTRSRWREGTGLGLPIAKALVELHGGRLDIRSVKNEGTEVTITLPGNHHLAMAEARETALGTRL